MAARSDAATDRVSRTTAPSLAAVTFTCWAKIGAVHAGNLFHPILRVEAGGGTAAIFSFRGTNGRTPTLYSASSTTGISGAEQSLSTWVFLAFTMNAGAAQLFYGTTPGSLTKVTGTVNTTGTPDTLTFFSRSPSDGSEWLEGTLAYCRLWTRVLSDAEVAAESQSASPASTTSIWGNWAFAAAALTDTVASRTLTAGSTALSADTDPTLGTDITGSGVLVAPHAVAAAAGTVAVSGSAAVTAPKATLAGSGSSTVAGSGATTAPPAQAAGSGSAVVGGSGALTAPAVAAAGAGTLVASGSGAAAAPAASAAGAGGVVAAGTSALVAPPAVVGGTGGTTTPAIEGGGAVSAPTPTLAGTGAVLAAAAAALTAPAPIATGSGTVIDPRQAAGVLVAPAAVLAGAGQVIVTGDGSLVGPAAVVHGYESAPQMRDITVTAVLLPSRFSARLLPSRIRVKEAG